MQQPFRVATVNFCQVRLTQAGLLNDPDRMFGILLSFLPKSEWIIGAEHDLLRTEHSGNTGNNRFVRRSCRVVKELPEVMTRLVLAFTLAERSFDSARQKWNRSTDVRGNNFEIRISVEEAA